MRTLFLAVCLISSPASAKKPNVDALSAQASQQPAEALVDLDAALQKAKSSKDLAVLHALRAQALATAASDPAFAAAHPDWVADVVASIVASQEQSASDAHALQRDLAAARVVEVLLASLESDSGQLSVLSLDGLERLATHRGDPQVFLLLGYAHLRGQTSKQAVAAYQRALDTVLSGPPTESSWMATTSVLDMLPILWSEGGEQEQVIQVFASAQRAHEHLGVNNPLSPDLARRLVWVQLVTTGMVAPAEVIASTTAYLSAQPQDAQVWTALGMYLHESGDLAGAETALRNSVVLDPTPFDSNYALGALYMDRAMRASQALLALPLADQDKGASLQAQIDSHYGSARESLEAAHRISPDDVGTMMGLVQVCAALEDLEAYKAYKLKLDARRSR